MQSFWPIFMAQLLCYQKKKKYIYHSWEMLDIENKFQRYKAEMTSQECFWRITYLPFSSFFAVPLHEQQLSSIFLKNQRMLSEDQQLKY